MLRVAKPDLPRHMELLLSWYKVYQQRTFAQRLQPCEAKAKPCDRAEIKETGTEKKRRGGGRKNQKKMKCHLSTAH